MKKLKAKIFVVLCVFVTMYSCKKEPKLTGVVHYKYVGLAKGHYEYHNNDFENNVFTHIVWDSTYEAFVNVVIDYDLGKVKFSAEKFYYPYNTLGVFEYDFDYDESKSIYTEPTTISGYFVQFRFAPGDSLIFRYRQYSGDVGPLYSIDEVTLNGVKAD
jgi:hypothetical protein